MRKLFFLFTFLICVTVIVKASDSLLIDSVEYQSETTIKPSKKILVFDIRDEISKPIHRATIKAFEKAREIDADVVLIQMNTYGGRVDIADSIRTMIINHNKPVLVFINNQAISAGALISIACDSIYMRKGGSIGAATVVSQSGEQVPDKYQSFMRSTMRATAQSHGKDTIITDGDTTYVWHRNPDIAQAMVDPKLDIEGVTTEGEVLTLTAEEAMNAGYCEGYAESIKEVRELAGIDDYEVHYYKPEGVEKLISFLLNPVVQGIFLLLIVGGVYLEFQTPGVGFPLAAAVVGAILYFSPLYLEGLAENWELLLFVAGIILIALEIFVIPGFGIAGIAGITFMLAGLTLSLVDNVVFEIEGWAATIKVFKAFVQVMISFVAAMALAIWVSRKVGTAQWFKGFALETVQNSSEGYISTDVHSKNLKGKEGIAHTVLRPSGRVMIDDELYDAIAEVGYIEKGEKVKVLRDEAGQIFVIKG